MKFPRIGLSTVILIIILHFPGETSFVNYAPERWGGVQARKACCCSQSIIVTIFLILFRLKECKRMENLGGLHVPKFGSDQYWFIPQFVWRSYLFALVPIHFPSCCNAWPLISFTVFSTRAQTQRTWAMCSHGLMLESTIKKMIVSFGWCLDPVNYR